MRSRLVLGFLCVALSACGPTGRPGSERAPGSESTATNAPADPASHAREDHDLADAAINFVVGGQELLDAPADQLPERIRSLWTVRAADHALSSTIERLVELRDRLGGGTGPTTFRQAVLALSLNHAVAGTPTATLWWVGVLSRSGAVEPQAQWATTTLSLRLEDDRWKVDSENTVDGPTPDHSVDTGPISTDEYDRRLSEMSDPEGFR